jgi:hypothetical protein
MKKFMVVFALMVASTAAHADSDGYFCIGPSYVAYELSFSGPLPNKHQLHIVRLNDQSNWKDAYVLELPEFQTQGMMCSESTVKVLAWDAIYTASWTSTDSRPSITAKSIQPGKFSDSEIPQLIDNFISRRSRLIWLSTLSTEYSFLLWIESVPDQNVKCQFQVRSWIERRRGQKVIDAKVLYTGAQPAECGE